MFQCCEIVKGVRSPCFVAVLYLVGLIFTSIYADTLPLALGYKPLPFSLPAPGSYSLPSLGNAADGIVLDIDGKTLHLHELYGDKCVLLSFIGTTCSDVNGCPLATSVFHTVQERLSSLPEGTEGLRLITVSFNPDFDTPEKMAHYGSGFTKKPEWHFLTAASQKDIDPILHGYGQSVLKEYDSRGQSTGNFSHILRVFLIDRHRRIRNQYTISFLHPDILINDLRTIWLEEKNTPSSILKTEGPDREQAVDKIASRHVTSKQLLRTSDKIGSATPSLIEYAKSPPLGLPALPHAVLSTLSPERIELGRQLFFDRRLSLNNTLSCGMCHVPEQGFTSHEQTTSVGIEGRIVRRNAPTLYNVAYYQYLFQDGRETHLEQQVWGPLLASNEMGAPSVGYVLQKIQAIPDYARQFQQYYGSPPTMETLGMALSAYERTLNVADSPFDRWYFKKQDQAIHESAKRGFTLFTGKAQCVTCHHIGKTSALFTDHSFHNTGIGFQSTQITKKAKQVIEIAPGVTRTVDTAALNAVSAPVPSDLGLYEITQLSSDRWKYRTPMLRNIALSAPYMHDGSLPTLMEVVRFYNQGGIPHEVLDPSIAPLHLTEEEMKDIVSFLETLTGSNIETILDRALSVPVGNPH